MLEAIVLAVALAMDSTAIAVAAGAAGIRSAAGVRMAVVFALFHVAMATIGWMIGTAAEAWIASWDHWVAFGLLGVIGGKMVISALRPGTVEIPASWGLLVGLAIATSIDAIAAGVTLPLLAIPELATIGLIGGVVFVFVVTGVRVGGCLGGTRFGRMLEVVGGLAVIGVGVRIVIQHV